MREGGDYLTLRMQDFFSFVLRDGAYLTCFLDCAQQRYLQQHKSGFSVSFYGGFQEAERKKALISDVELEKCFGMQSPCASGYMYVFRTLSSLSGFGESSAMVGRKV